MAQNLVLPTIAASELTLSQSSTKKTTPIDMLKTIPDEVVSALPEQAVILWGGPGDPNGEFDGGLNDWTTEGTDATTMMLDAPWLWEEDADINEGAFAMTGGANEPINSPSAANGAMGFNSDLYDNGGDGGNFGNGPVPGPHLSHLISPIIDLSNNTEIAVNFYSFHRNFQSTVTISYSNDGGTTWSMGVPVHNPNKEARINANPLNQEALVYLPGAGGTDQFQFRFTFDGNYYFWMVDDVALIEAPRNDIKMESFFYTPAAYAQPIRHIDIDTFAFSMNVSNKGTLPQTNVALGAQVRDMDLNIIYETELVLDELPVGITDSVFQIPGTFVPDMLDEAQYVLTYTIEADSSDQWDVDNVDGDAFEVTDLIFSTEDNDQGAETYTTLAGAGPWQIGNTYTTGGGFDSDYYTAESITFAARAAAGEVLEGKTVNVWLLEFIEGADFDDNARYDANSGLNIIGFGVHEYTTEENNDRVTVALEDFNASEEIILQENQDYLVLVDYSLAPVLRQGFNTKIDYRDDRNKFLAFNETNNNWFGGFTNNDQLLPIIRLQLGLTVVGTNDQQLAESTLNVQPNPVADQLAVNIDLETATKAVLTITDITGKVMDIQEFDAVVNQTVNLNVGEYANGTYLVRLATEEGARTVKVLVQH